MKDLFHLYRSGNCKVHELRGKEVDLFLAQQRCTCSLLYLNRTDKQISSGKCSKNILNVEFKIMNVFKVKPVQLIGASATVNDELKEDLIEIGWGDHVTVVQSPSLEGKRRNVPPCIKHQYVICDHSLGITKAEALAR